MIKNIPLYIALFALCFTLIFIWHMELVTDFNEYTLTNGFSVFNPEKVYHVFMYLCLLFVFLNSVISIKAWKNKQVESEIQISINDILPK